ncbi:hypothetical protein [Nostoc sp. WHI]|uniref:hypothetical protein n=1 Tax=Nostoc sp. WHI TaxID=2650611 RepID=UPI0018C7A7E6|nr:hypothetical protein [Nostoc sp. WHI]MBG1271752.1 hypothetical protein [Nostoc sp. WHI]
MSSARKKTKRRRQTANNSLLESLQETDGDDFSKLSKKDKLVLISVIAAQLSVECPGLVLDQTYSLAKQINEGLPIGDRAGLIEAMIAQVRWGEDLAVTEGGSPIQQ